MRSDSYHRARCDKKYGFVVLSNSAGAFDLVSQGVLQILQGKEVTAASFIIPGIIPNPNKDLTEFLGHYKRSDGSETEIDLRNDSLYSADIRLYPTSPIAFLNTGSLEMSASCGTVPERSRR